MHTSIGAAEMGIEANFSRTARLDELLLDPENLQQWQAQLPQLQQQETQYRAEMQMLQQQKEQLLPSSFWLRIYSNHSISMPELNLWFHMHAQNSTVSQLTQQHR